MEKHRDKLELIKRANGDLKINSAKLDAGGFHSTAIVINDDLIFRFPIRDEFREEYLKEKAMLDIINPLISSTKVPNITLYKLDNQIFTGHKLIPGISYSKISQQLTNVEKNNIAMDVARFLAELHSIETNDVAIKQFSIDDYEIKQNINILYDYLKTPERINELNKVLNEFENKNQNLELTNIVLSHNDLNENNIIIDEKTKKLSGIIDFGNNSKRDFSAEFATLLKYDGNFTRKIIEEYEKLTKRKVDLEYTILLQKIRCYGGILYSIMEDKRGDIQRYEEWLEKLSEIEC